jgi:1-acyl-sn-glycerol-3-phosphate acyltransferase
MGKILALVRYVVVGTWFFGTSIVAFLVSITRPFNVRSAALFRRWAFPLGRKILGVKLFVKHRERLTQRDPCVFIANHQHTLDMFVLGSALPDRTVTIGKREIAYVPFFGWLFYLSGNLLIDRKDHLRAMQTMQKARDELKKGMCILLAPEGTRSRGKGLGPFKKGAFHLAVDAQVPLQPLAISSFHKVIDFSKKRAGQILLEVLEPIPTKGKTEADIPALMEEAWQRMNDAIERLDAEVASLPGASA